MTVGNLTYTNEPVIGNIISGSAAEQAHLKANDRIITIDGKKITTWDEIRPSLQGTANHGVTVVVEMCIRDRDLVLTLMLLKNSRKR